MYPLESQLSLDEREDIVALLGREVHDASLLEVEDIGIAIFFAHLLDGARDAFDERGGLGFALFAKAVGSLFAELLDALLQLFDLLCSGFGNVGVESLLDGYEVTHLDLILFAHLLYLVVVSGLNLGQLIVDGLDFGHESEELGHIDIAKLGLRLFVLDHYLFRLGIHTKGKDD